jgi:NAD-dependent SIR2 family protein deacetylase
VSSVAPARHHGLVLDAAAQDSALSDLHRLVAGGDVVVLSGAGLSTESGIPDYRGPSGTLRRHAPMNYHAFVHEPVARHRYWARSYLGWRQIAGAQPNDGHRAVAALQAAGLISGVITQNVDGLHSKAGSLRVVDLHGASDRVRCIACGQVYARDDFAARMTESNPWLEEPDEVKLRPDGDVEVSRIADFITPACTACGGILRPDVVFFGEFIPIDKFAAAAGVLLAADAFLIAGSSLVVNSGIRLLDRAVKRSLPIVIVNRGATRGDERATVKLDAGTTQTLGELAERLGA